MFLKLVVLILLRLTANHRTVNALVLKSPLNRFWGAQTVNHRSRNTGTYQGHDVDYRHQMCISTGCTRNCPLFLFPIRSFADDVKILSKADENRFNIANDGIVILNDTSYELAIMEENDVGNVAQFVVRVFGGDAINLSQNLTSVERLLVSPAVDVVNGYSSLVAFAEVVAGLRSRCSFRFQSKPGKDLVSAPNVHGLSRDEKIRRIFGSSIVIVLAATTHGPSQSNSDRHTADNPIIASIELRLQPCDAKIPFTLPWIDRIERKLFSMPEHHEIQPYLSNLCVGESFRGRSIATILVRCVENIAHLYWGYNKMYLHVDLDNVAAVQLYKREGYNDVGRRWNPFWAGKAADIGYLVKNLR